MPKRCDIESILVLGAGPIVIGQACEFDYSGTQACIALKESGYRVILHNPNPATIMTDPGYSDVTYMEPLTVEYVTQIISKERPDAILATVGGQTALNLAVELSKKGVLKKFGVTVIGADISAIERAENRRLFHEVCLDIGLDVPKSHCAGNKREVIAFARKNGFPIMVRPSFVLGGLGTGIAYDEQELMEICDKAFEDRPDQELTLEESLLGWKEFELEVVRDKKDNCIVVCAIENLDPLGIHTGDSITVSPIQTLTDKEYQVMRLASFNILRKIGVDTGGSNVQFAVNPANGRMVVIEMNPRVSRSSALASKVTGFPIAKVAAKLAVGYTLDELGTDILGGKIPAAFEPVIDYVVVKIPVFQFEKFPDYTDSLRTQMQSVGEAIAIGQTFSEALLKCMRSVETTPLDDFDASFLTVPNSKRIWHVFNALQKGISVDEIHKKTLIDCWFLEEIFNIIELEKKKSLDSESLTAMKKAGFSDRQIGQLLCVEEKSVRKLREKLNISPVYKRVDGCSAEFSTSTAYLYSTYGYSCESNPSSQKKVVIVGSGPNRIGQGIEFDYSCVNVVKTLKSLHYEAIMVNCNPETVSTDFDCADRLYCSPLTIEDVLHIIEVEKPVGVFLQFGGQIPLELAQGLSRNGVSLLGIDLSIIDTCEDREKFKTLLQKLNLNCAESYTIFPEDPLPNELSFPLIIRPSYVLGGRSMAVVDSKEELLENLNSLKEESPDHPILIEQFLKNALEIEVDAISDGKNVFIPTILEQLQPAGVHSGDSTSFIPTRSISDELQNEIIDITQKISLDIGIKGFINIQFAIYEGSPYIIEVNPRCSRSVPFLSKALGIDLVEIATKCIMGFSLPKDIIQSKAKSSYFFVKEPVFSSSRFKSESLGPEMKSTGEVMSVGLSFEEAYNKALLSSGKKSPKQSYNSIYSLQEIFDEGFIQEIEKVEEIK